MRSAADRMDGRVAQRSGQGGSAGDAAQRAGRVVHAAGRMDGRVAHRSGRDGSCTRRTEWMGGWRSAADRMDGRVVQTTVAYLSVVADEHISYLKAAYAKSKPQLV